MKIILFASLFVSMIAFGQEVIDSQKASELGLGLEDLDARYKSAINAKPEKAVFKSDEEQQELLKAYTDFLQQIGAFISEKKFSWDTKIRGWNRIYMKADGTVEYFIYRLPEDLPVEKKLQFENLLRQFLANHKFPIESPVPFSQCSTVVWSN